ncbi:MAG: YfhO family protein [Clostridiales bacterium]|nr:YfhO family protein [Clostridiales bacterium]
MIEKTSLESSRKRNIDLRPLVAFFATLIAMFAVFAINQITPFGPRNILTSDLGAQYGPYLIGYKNALKSGQSLLYSQSLGLGQNTLGVFAYYLSSPLSFLVFLFPATRLQESITILISVKLAFAGAFMTWLLDRKFKSKDWMSVLFGLMYPLCSFAIIFMFNIMWLDGFAILPLLILLTEKFVEDRRTWPKLTLVLFILFVSGYYMAYMIGIFSFLYLLSYMWYKGAFAKEKGNDGAKKVGSFILSAVVAGMMSACILIPAALDTLGNGDLTKSASMTMNPNFKLISLFDQFLETGVGDLSKNLPYIFGGLAVLFLCILFFFNKQINKKLKFGVALAFGFAVLSFHFPLLNLAWHLFDTPNWFGYRYSYLLSFVMVLVAFYSYLHINGVERKYFFLSWGIIVGIASISQSFGQMGKEDSTFFATLALSFLICVLFYGKTLKTWPEEIANLKRIGTLLLVAVILVEIVVMNPRCYMPSVFSGRKDADEYVDMIDDLQTLAKQEDASGWYRSEIHSPWHTFIRGNTLAFYTNKHGISIFASMSNKRNNHFLKQLGYEMNYNYFCIEHQFSIFPTDTLLGVRYIISTDHDLKDMPYKFNVGNYYLYENKEAMPIAFLASADAYSFDGYQLEKDDQKKDYFEFQEKWITSLSGVDASDLYDTFNAEWEVKNGEKTDIQPSEDITAGDYVENELNYETKNTKSSALQYYLRNNTKSPMVLRTKIKIESDKPLYMVIPYLFLQCVSEVYVDDELVCGQDSASYYSQIVNLGAFQQGREIKVEIRTTQDIYASFAPIFAYCNTENISKQTTALRQGLDDVSVKNGHVVVKTTSDTDKMLFTSIPFEKGWSATVDGQKTEIVSYQDAFVSIPLSAGSHTIELRFTPPGWKPGFLASGIGLMAFVLLSFVMLKKNKNIVEAKAEGTDTEKVEAATQDSKKSEEV